MRKSGFHVQKTSTELARAIELVLPTVIVSLAHDYDFWRDVKQQFPELFLIGRRYENGLDWRQVTGRQWAERCADLAMPYDAFVTFNEPVHVYNWITAATAAHHDDWCCDFRRRALELGYQAVGLNVPTGHFHQDSIVRWFPNICQEFDYIGLHEYSARAMWDQNPKLQRVPEFVPQDEGDHIGYWYCQRYRDWYAAIVERWPARAGKVQIVVTECGIAMGVIPGYGDVGWKGEVSEEQYAQSLCWYFGSANEDPAYLGGAIFMIGAADPDWDSFETLPLAARLTAIPQVPSPEPEPPPKEEPMIAVYDFNNQPFDPNATVRDMAWLRSIFGDIQVHSVRERLDLEIGDIIYEVDWFDCKVGDTAIMVHVKGPDGNPARDVTGIFGWPDAEPHNLPRTWDLWTPNGAIGELTNVDGDAGLGSYGTGAYYDSRTERGPHCVWLYTLPADMVTGLGMLTWALGVEGNHLHVNIGYRARVYQGDQPPSPPSPPPPGQDGIVAMLRSRAAEMQATADDLLAAAASLEEADTLAARLDQLL